MKSFSEFKATLAEAVAPSVTQETPQGDGGSVGIEADEQLDENTVELKPHTVDGKKGTHFKVVKGVKGHLEAGEVIHDSHVDDLHDMGYKVKIHEDTSEEDVTE